MVLLDLEGVRQYRALSESRRIKNLVQLNRTLGRYLRNVQKLWVLQAYLKRRIGQPAVAASDHRAGGPRVEALGRRQVATPGWYPCFNTQLDI